MGTVRLELRLTTQSEWIRNFDPRDWTVFVPHEVVLAHGTLVHLDLDAGGWQVTLRGTVVGQRETPAGAVVAVDSAERGKINYLNGFVRGGLLNLRERRRLPVRLAVMYGAVEGPANTFTKDINEEGLFLLTDKPLPETSQVHMLVTVPGRAQPVSVFGKVSHTILTDDDEPAGMGIVFDLDDAQRALLREVVADLQQQFFDGLLPTSGVE